MKFSPDDTCFGARKPGQPTVVGGLSHALLAALVALAACGHKQKPPPAPVAAAEPDEPDLDCGDSQPFLYEIYGGDAPSYVLGTMHMGFGVADVLQGDCRRVLDEAETVVLEADTRNVSPTEVMGLAILPAGKSLRSLLGTDDWDTLVMRVGRHMPPLLLDRAQPWFALVTVELLQLQELTGAAGEASTPAMDAELTTLADSSGKELVFLETVAQQMSLFSKIPLSEQVGSLKARLSAEPATDVNSLLAAYRSGDEAALTAAALPEADVKANAAFYDALLFKRNAAWAKSLRSRFKQGGVFMAVGAAHLVGKNSFLSALEKAGFEIERVP